MLLGMSQTAANENIAANDSDDFVTRATAGDQTAYEQLYREYSGQIYALCLRMTANKAAAEDATQDAFIQAWNKLDSFRGDSAFSSWLHRIAVNVVLTQLRKNKRELERLQGMPTGETATADTGHQLPDIEKAIAALPTRARHVFVLVGVYGYTHEQAAGSMDIAVGTCKAHLHRARQMLAEQLEQDHA